MSPVLFIFVIDNFIFCRNSRISCIDDETLLILIKTLEMPKSLIKAPALIQGDVVGHFSP